MLVGSQRSRDPEVGDQGVAVPGQQQVLRLDVPVHYAVVVRVLESLGCFTGDPQRIFQSELALAAQPVPE